MMLERIQTGLWSLEKNELGKDYLVFYSSISNQLLPAHFHIKIQINVKEFFVENG
jgi:hypothetical protein